MKRKGCANPVKRAGELLGYLLSRPRGLAELVALLDSSPAQLGRDLKALASAGWRVKRQGKPVSVWVPVPAEWQVRRGANWTDPGTGAACFVGLGDSEDCLACGRHIRRHYGLTEYRCQPKPKS